MWSATVSLGECENVWMNRNEHELGNAQVGDGGEGQRQRLAAHLEVDPPAHGVEFDRTHLARRHQTERR